MKYSILKISGSVLDDVVALSLVPQLVKNIIQAGKRPIIVHGAGKQVDLACQSRGISIQKIKGRRVTSPEIMQLMLELVHGQLNRLLVASLLENHLSAFGITSADLGLMEFKKRAPKEIEGELIDFGQVGDLVKVDVSQLKLIAGNSIPVISCLGFSAKDKWLNVNADTITKELALAISATEVVMLSETAGVKNAQGNWLTFINKKEIEIGIKDAWIRDGMIVKLEQAIELAQQSIPVQIGTIHGILSNQFTTVTN